MTIFKLLQKIILFFLIFQLTGCGSVKRFTTDRYSENLMNTPEPEVYYKKFVKAPVIKSFEGLASFYAHKYHNRLTANGETYNMYELTAAHPYFPFETILRIVNLENKNKVIVRINDRMPKHPERLIDLSLGTAKKLGMIEDGIIRVKLEILRWGKDQILNENGKN